MDEKEKVEARRSAAACSPRVLKPDEMLMQELVAMVDAGRYGDNLIIEHGKLRWILEAVQQIKEQRDEARGIAERFRTYVPKDAIVPLYIPWDDDSRPLTMLSKMKPLPEHLRGCEFRSRVPSAMPPENTNDHPPR